MTRDPIHVYDKDKASDALALMTSRKFRHLPVISDIVQEGQGDTFQESENSAQFDKQTNVVGLLDITRCIYDKLSDLENKAKEGKTATLRRRCHHLKCYGCAFPTWLNECCIASSNLSEV